jgi:nucleoid DNA-binding protein
MTSHKNSIHKTIGNKVNIPKKDSYDIMLSLLDELKLGIISGKKVKIFNFGTWEIKHKKERKGRNPITKEEFIISERNVISFHYSIKLKEKMNEKD